MSNLNKLVQPECGAPNPLVAAAQQISSLSKSGITTPMTSLARLHMQQDTNRLGSMNFVKEFSQQHSMAATAGTSSLQASILKQSDTNPQAHIHHSRRQDNQMAHQRLHPMQYFNMMQRQQNIHQQQQNQAQDIDASDQLENKYRNDMIAQTTSKKYDDIEFWQSLSQSYLGPTTMNNMARLRAERAARAEQTSASQNDTQLDDDKTDETNYQQDIWNTDELDKWLKDLDLSSMENNEYIFDDRNPLKDKFEDPFAEGLKRLEIGDIPSAALLFEVAVQKEPDNSQAWQYLGTTQAQNEKDRSAISALKNCLKHDESNQLARLAIAASLVNETKYLEACNHLIEWLIRHDKYGPGVNASLEEYNQLNNTLKREEGELSTGLPEQHYKYVMDKFFQAARMSPNNPDPEVQNSLGVIFNMRGEYEKAEDCFKAALSVKSNDSLLWNRLGATLANGNKSEEAVVAYRRALEIAPGFLRSRYNLAISLIHLNLYDEAARQLVQILNSQVAGNDGRVRYTDSSSVRNRSITSTSIWNTLRTVATLMNKPELYPYIDGRNLDKCNESLLKNHH